MKISNGKIAASVAANLSTKLAQANLPPEFLGSWEHCSGSRKSVLAHSVGLGMLSASVAEIPSVKQVAIDVRLKTWDDDENRITWQPDVIGYRRDGNEFIPVVYADFESPNSSDDRIPAKDVDGYRQWLAANGGEAPYVIVVCLPARPHGFWPLRYTGGYNANHVGRLADLQQQGPQAFWTASWRQSLTQDDLGAVTILSVGDGRVEKLRLFN